jgi:hypothetical protein
MKRHRLIPMMMVAATLAVLVAGAASAKSHTTAKVVISPRVGLGVWIGRDVDRHGPSHGPIVSPRPWHRRVVPLWTPRPKVIVVSPPVVEPVVVPAVPVIEPIPVTITVWVTNSNGSRIAVQLTQEGAWYKGPRGEYYTSMPTNEQLRVVYGF